MTFRSACLLACILRSSAAQQGSCGASDSAPTCGRERKLADEDGAAANQCGLYLARSAIPGAGLGVFTGTDLEPGSSVSHESRDDSWFQEMLIPIVDKYKTIPYRGNQRFLSWLGYVWAEEANTFHLSAEDAAFPNPYYSHFQNKEGLNVADEGLDYFYLKDKYHGEIISINVFAPGLASLVNSDPAWLNVALNPSEGITLNAETADEDNDRMMDPLDVAMEVDYTRLAPGSGFVAIRSIPAGGELLINYGEDWHDRHRTKQYEYDDERVSVTGVPRYENQEAMWSEMDFSELPTEDLKRQFQNWREDSTSQEMNGNLAKVEAKRREDVEAVLASRKKQRSVASEQLPPKESSPISDQQDTTATARLLEEEEDDDDELELDTVRGPVRDMDWLQKNGVCLDNLEVAASTIPDAGRGAYAKRFMPKGSLLAPAPLLALKRSDLVIYETDEDSETIKGTLNFDKVVGHELLLNYCYGHPESDLLLVPYSPVVNFINHPDDLSKVNAEIRWASEEQAQTLLKRSPNDWLDSHPLDVTDQSGELLAEFVALRDIQPGEEIFINYGKVWAKAWNEGPEDVAFRHEIGAPEGFFPTNWLNQTIEYEIAPIGDLKPGEIRQLTWKHNGKPFSQNAFVVGLPENMTKTVKEFAEDRGIMSLYEQLLAEKIMASEQAHVVTADQHPGEAEEWFIQRYKSVDWDFNMHYIAPWSQTARRSLLGALGTGGYDHALNGIGNHFGLDSLTCFHVSYMGVSEADKSFMHTDLYGTDGKAFNVIFPIVTVDGSKPELDLQSDNADVVVAVKYEHDRAFVLRDWAYHRTSAVEYDEKGQIRVVMGMYCAEIDEDNHEIMKFLYNLEEVPPFMGEFDLPNRNIHWDKTGAHRLPRL